MTAESTDVYVIHCDGGYGCEEVFEGPFGDTYFEWPGDARKFFGPMGWTHVPEEHRGGKDFCPTHSNVAVVTYG